MGMCRPLPAPGIRLLSPCDGADGGGLVREAREGYDLLLDFHLVGNRSRPPGLAARCAGQPVSVSELAATGGTGRIPLGRTAP